MVSHIRLQLTDSTLAANQASYGGGLTIIGNATLANCTLSANEGTGGPGGGGALWVEGGDVRLVNCTITGNRVTGRWYGGGGGLHVTGGSSTVTLQNTIVAGNTTVLTGGDSSTIANLLVMSGAVQHQGRHNFIGGDPMLGPLQDNGGPTWTHLPLPGSPVIDAGSNDLAVDLEGNPLPTDQRGFDRVQHGRVDIGAVETPSIDLDEDGLPNDWESAHRLDPENPLDALLDSDDDGMTNHEEYLADTDPRDSTSNLHMAIERSGGQVRLSFPTSADRFYTLQHRSDVGDAEWQEVEGAVSLPGNGGVMTLRVPASHPSGFHRVQVSMTP